MLKLHAILILVNTLENQGINQPLQLRYQNGIGVPRIYGVDLDREFVGVLGLGDIDRNHDFQYTIYQLLDGPTLESRELID